MDNIQKIKLLNELMSKATPQNVDSVSYTHLDVYKRQEFIHAAQDRVYFNGILQYAGKEGTPNIEFEAKIIQELIYCANGYGFGGLGAGPTHADDYTRWIMSVSYTHLDVHKRQV